MLMANNITAFEHIAPYLTHPLVLIGFVLMLVFSVHRLILKAGILPKMTKRQGSNIVSLLLHYGFLLAVLIMMLGFGLQFYQTHRDSEKAKEATAYNIKEIVTNLTNHHQLDTQTKDDQIKGLTEAVTALSKGQNILGTEAQVKAALDTLAKGNTTQAKALFAKAAEKGEQEAKQTAEAYLNLGALAFLD